MKMPKYRKTKWKVRCCKKCGIYFPKWAWCKSGEHEIVELDNVPFFVPDMKILHFGFKGWAKLESKILGQRFNLSPSHVDKVTIEYGVEPGGGLPNRWWMWAKIGGSASLKQVDDK